MTGIILLILLGSLIGGFRLWKRRRIISLLLFSPLLVVLSVIGYLVYQSSYETTPDSLHFSVQKKDETYLVTGVWKDRLDAYRFPSDFLLFYIPDNEKAVNVNRDRPKHFKKMELDYLNQEVEYWAEKEYSSEWKPQIFDLETSRRFEFSFVLPENIEPGDVHLYYAHTREEPMDALEFWFKEIDLLF